MGIITYPQHPQGAPMIMVPSDAERISFPTERISNGAGTTTGIVVGFVHFKNPGVAKVSFDLRSASGTSSATLQYVSYREPQGVRSGLYTAVQQKNSGTGYADNTYYDLEPGTIFTIANYLFTETNRAHYSEAFADQVVSSSYVTKVTYLTVDSPCTLMVFLPKISTSDAPYCRNFKVMYDLV